MLINFHVWLITKRFFRSFDCHSDETVTLSNGVRLAGFQCFFIGLSCSITFFPFLFFLSIGWYFGAGVFVLIGCISLSLSLALPTFFNNNNNCCQTSINSVIKYWIFSENFTKVASKLFKLLWFTSWIPYFFKEKPSRELIPVLLPQRIAELSFPLCKAPRLRRISSSLMAIMINCFKAYIYPTACKMTKQSMCLWGRSWTLIGSLLQHTQSQALAELKSPGHWTT